MTVTLKKKPTHICIAMPAYTGQVFTSTMTALLTDLSILQSAGARVTMNVKTGNAMIADCRAMLVSEFLANEDFTHLVMIDSDVTWAPGSLPRLVAHDVDFVCGLYPKRSDPVTFDFRSDHPKGEDAIFTLDNKGLMEVSGVPFGFVVMKRAMLEKLSSVYDAEFGFPVDRKHSPTGRAVGLFEPYRLEDGSKLGEDYAFCQRWRDQGGRVLVDPSILMGHLGYKVWIGELGHVLTSEDKETEDKAA